MLFWDVKVYRIGGGNTATTFRAHGRQAASCGVVVVYNRLKRLFRDNLWHLFWALQALSVTLLLIWELVDRAVFPEATRQPLHYADFVRALAISFIICYVAIRHAVRKDAERERLEREIKSRDRHLAAILTDSADAIIGMDTEGVITSWNRGAETIFGYTADEMVGQPFLRIVPENHRSDLDFLAREVEERGFLKHFETERVTKEGRVVTVDLTRTAIRDESGRLIGSSAMLRDITDKKRLEEQLIRSAKLASIGMFTAGLAHEIRNPLNSIGIQVFLLERRLKHAPPELQEQCGKGVGVIRKEVGRLENLVNEFLLFANQPSLNIEMVDLHSIIDSAAEHLFTWHDRLSVDFAKNCDPNLPLIAADSEKIRQVFLNVMQNAIQAMPDGGSLTLTTSARNGYVTTTIEDTGIGLPATAGDHLFEVFFSTKEGGTGLGLPIAYQIVETHGGKISVLPRPKGEPSGTVCTIELPIEQR